MFATIRQAVAGLLDPVTDRLHSDDAPSSESVTTRGTPVSDPETVTINPVPVRQDTAQMRAKRFVRLAARRTPRPRSQVNTVQLDSEAGAATSSPGNSVFKTRVPPTIDTKYAEETGALPGEEMALGTTVFAIDRSGSLTGDAQELALAENFVAGAVHTFEEASATDKVAVTEMYDSEVSVILPFLSSTDSMKNSILTDGKSEGSSPLTELIKTSDSLPDAEPTTIIVLTHGCPDNPPEMQRTVQEVDATVLFIGVGELRFPSGNNITGTSRHYSTLTSEKDVTSALSAFFQR